MSDSYYFSDHRTSFLPTVQLAVGPVPAVYRLHRNRKWGSKDITRLCAVFWLFCRLFFVVGLEKIRCWLGLASKPKSSAFSTTPIHPVSNSRTNRTLGFEHSLHTFLHDRSRESAGAYAWVRLMHILARSKLFNQTLTYDAIMLEILQPSPPYAHHKSIHPASKLHFDTNVAKLQLVLCGHKWRIEHSFVHLVTKTIPKRIFVSFLQRVSAQNAAAFFVIYDHKYRRP